MSVYAMLDTKVDALTIDDLHAHIADSIRLGERKIFTSHNLHSLCLLRKDAKLQAFYECADYIRIDGMAVVLLGRLLGLPLERQHRVTWVDWLPRFMQEAARAGWRVFCLGSSPGVADRAAALLRERFPSVQLGIAHGFFDTRPGSTDSVRVIQTINAFRPHVLLVGMGVPRQQHWVLDSYQQLAVNAISTSGAALDYVAGAIPTPPRWSGRLGLEWAFRLAAEPRRLGRRYLVEPWTLLPVLAKHVAARCLSWLGPAPRGDG